MLRLRSRTSLLSGAAARQLQPQTARAVLQLVQGRGSTHLLQRRLCSADASSHLSAAEALKKDSAAAQAVRPLLYPSRVHDVFNAKIGMEEGDEPAWISDIGRQFSDADRAAVNELCARINASWRFEVAVVVLSGLPDDVQPSAFSAALLNYWGIGDKRLHSGLLVVLLCEQRRLEMRTGYGATRVLSPDILKKVQQEQMIPHFRSGSYGAGVVDGMKAIADIVEKSAPGHWRWGDTGKATAQLNRHGFGGGQTSIDEYKPAASSSPASPDAAPPPSAAAGVKKEK
eukprot:TRINITY_DN18985_c0_g1_i1.p1 TRINITY_DN18985_c0_g1~~TRINITY_DN18985_c0_g1_i1.p1  ORF type:complete len:286 (-),score=67.50 TRINITY_DN18985_c0_g1_i1:453-1310(-)